MVLEDLRDVQKQIRRQKARGLDKAYTLRKTVLNLLDTQKLSILPKFNFLKPIIIFKEKVF